MAKIPYTKIRKKFEDNSAIPVQIGEQTISVRQYLPIQEKLGLISRVIELAHEQDYNYSNPIKAQVYLELEMIYAYSDISFTEKQKEDPAKLYDELWTSGILNDIINTIPDDEIAILQEGMEATIESIYKYQNSALGILDGVKNSYSETELDVEKLKIAVEELQKSNLITEIVPMLGLN